MSRIFLQVAFLASYVLFFVLLRAAAREHLRRRAQEEDERQEALRREWRVGIPYDPDPDRKSRRR